MEVYLRLMGRTPHREKRPRSYRRCTLLLTASSTLLLRRLDDGDDLDVSIDT